MRVNFSGPLRLVASAMLACLWSCQDRVQFDPSLTYQALTGDLGVRSLDLLSKPTQLSWIELPCRWDHRGGSSEGDTSTGERRCERHLEFDCGTEEELDSFLKAMPALIRTRCERTGADWGPARWETRAFSLDYVEGPIHGSISVSLGTSSAGENELTLKIEEARVGEPPADD